MDINDKVTMSIIDRDDETNEINEIKIRLNMAYGVASLEKGEK